MQLVEKIMNGLICMIEWQKKHEKKDLQELRSGAIRTQTGLSIVVLYFFVLYVSQRLWSNTSQAASESRSRKWSSPYFRSKRVRSTKSGSSSSRAMSP